MTEDEMVGCHHQLNGHEFQQAPGVGDGQGGLVCCSLLVCKELDMMERLNKKFQVLIKAPENQPISKLTAYKIKIQHSLKECNKIQKLKHKFIIQDPIKIYQLCKRKKQSEVTQSCLTLCDPMDHSLPGSSVHGNFQAIHWSGLPFPSPGDLPDPGIEPRSPALQADALPSETQGKPQLCKGVGQLSEKESIYKRSLEMTDNL